MAKTGLMKKYIKLAGGDFKKAWKLQKAAERKRKKPAKKKTAKKKTASKKVSRKKAPAKKRTVKKTVKKTTHKRKVGTMAKRKKSKAKKTRRRSTGGGGKIQKTLMDGAAAVGGAIGAGLVANALPLPDPRIKAAIPIAAGIFIASSKMGRGRIPQMAAIGMIAAGGLSLLKQFVPNVPLLAGEDDLMLDYVSPDGEARAMLGYTDEDDELEDLLGAPVEVGEEDDELFGESVDLVGEDFLTTADY